MLKRIGILSIFLCAYTLFMLHNFMPHVHDHEHKHKHTTGHHDHSKQNHHHSQEDYHHHDKGDNSNSDNSLIDHSEAFGVAIVKSNDGLIAKKHEQSPYIDFILPSQTSDILAFEHPPDKLDTHKHPLHYSNSFNVPKSLRAPPAYFLL